ncbi:MAG: leucine-rich repeat protein [Lachnospiraceae bacterium]|nr:leucine-rich repeat protein [Lachnospiraceae bacterium]
MESHKEKDGEREKGSGLPVIVVNGDGHIIGTRRGEELTHVVLSHINNIKNGVSDRSKRAEGYRIEDGAFSKCSNMKRLVVMNSMDVTYVAEDAFQGCPSDLEVYCNRDTYLWKRLPKLGIKRRECREDDYKSAMLVGEERAEAIEQKAFAPLSEEMKERMAKDFGGLVVSLEVYENLSKEEVVLPRSLKKIGGDCFAGCTSLKKVTVKSPDVVFDGENKSKTVDGIFTLCGVEFIEETKKFTKSEMVLCGPKDSTAQRYAVEHGIRFRGQQ